MRYRKYNEKSDDADARPKYDVRLNTADNLKSLKLKRAHDVHDMKQEQKRLASDILEIWEIDDD